MAASSSSFQENNEEVSGLGGMSGWVEARTDCPHLASLSDDLYHLPTLQSPCNRCDHDMENWVCLRCKEVLCSRFIQAHMLQHFRETQHCLAMSFSDLSAWCFECDSYVDAQVIAQLRPAYETMHFIKFGQAPPYRSDLM